ncbi:MAG: T9SS type A sorting domain-containing protein [candidate division Zixibacteria bacterium]|nr:T9SS type A sorting domain-containing protein [candidate division Zixibacteria bacterium]
MVYQDGGCCPGSQTLNVVHDSVYGYFTGAHLQTSNKGNCTIDSCSFIANYTAGAQSQYGLYCSQDAAVKMRSSRIINYGLFGLYSYKSATNLGKTAANNGGIDDPGNNSIYTAGHADPVCEDCIAIVRSVYHVGNSSTDTLRAENNWWGASPPQAGWFSTKVDYNPWLTSNPLPKMAPPSLPEVRAEVPRSFEVRQNYPNPFNPSTTIEFSLHESSRVRISIYNVLGQVVSELANQDYAPGRYQLTWDGTDRGGQSLASGVYFYRVVAGEHAETKKMVLLR